MCAADALTPQTCRSCGSLTSNHQTTSPRCRCHNAITAITEGHNPKRGSSSCDPPPCRCVRPLVLCAVYSCLLIAGHGKQRHPHAGIVRGVVPQAVNPKGALNVTRRTWDKEEYALRAAERDSNVAFEGDVKAEDDLDAKLYAKADAEAAGPAGSERKFLKAREFKLNVDAKVGQMKVAPLLCVKQAPFVTVGGLARL